MHTDLLALHIANGIVNAPVSVLFAVVAAAVLALCVRRARRDLDERLAPMAGLVAAFIFAAQMLNFPVLPGVSGHLVGGALAAMLVGPWVGALCVSLVLIVQCLVFADGGLTALGLNITNMALIGTAASYVVIAGLLRTLAKTPLTTSLVAFCASLISVVVASLGFVVQYALGGTTPVPLASLLTTMVGTHLLIGIGEGVITMVTVGAVAKARPDLVYALRARRAPYAPAEVTA